MFIKQLEIFKEWANVVNRKFLKIFQQETQFEIRPCTSPNALNHILEFEDGSEVYDIAAYSINQLNPIIKFTDQNLNTVAAQSYMSHQNDALYQQIHTALKSLRLPYFIYDKYMLYKIDQAVCCKLFKRITQLLADASTILKSKSKSILAEESKQE